MQSRKALERAKALQQGGALAEAERLYLSVLRREPANLDALHGLALVYARHGALDEARQLIDQVLGLDPTRTDAHFHRAEIADGLGDSQSALESYEQALARDPRHFAALVNMGDALLRMERPAEALLPLDRAVALRPGDAAALNNRGNALQALKRHEEALACFDSVAAMLPEHADVLNNRASALLSLGRFAEAEAACRRALVQRPRHVQALLNLGRAHGGQGRLEEALHCFDDALAEGRDDSEARRERAMILLALQRYGEAADDLNLALKLRPDLSGTWSDLGAALLHQERYREALEACDKAIALQDDNAKAWANRGLALQFLNRHDEAVPNYETALRLDPDSPNARGRLAWLRLNRCEWGLHAEAVGQVTKGVAAGKRITEPFELLFLSDRADLQLKCAQTYAQDNYADYPDPLWRGEAYGHSRIRVAYISADFRVHPTSFLLAGLLEQHDRSRFEIYGISIGPEASDAMAERVAAACEHFARVRERTDRAIAEFLRVQEIDIAVDLMGYTSFCRTNVFAMRPCPVQVNYLGFPGTMGSRYMDYIVADPFLIPPGREGAYSERVVRLPDMFQANDFRRPRAERVPSRAALGLPDSGAVFCSFNKASKIVPEVFDTWMELLNAVPGAVLWLQAGSESMHANLRREAEARGIESPRIVFAQMVPYHEHLARLQQADLALDTLPFNGGATTSDALWSGVPVVTCPGDAFAARMSGSLLRAVGMPELVAGSMREYRDLAIRLATHPHELARLKQSLALNRGSCPLFDTDRFRRHLEAAYEVMRRRTESDEPPTTLEVASSDSGCATQS